MDSILQTYAIVILICATLMCCGATKRWRATNATRSAFRLQKIAGNRFFTSLDPPTKANKEDFQETR